MAGQSQWVETIVVIIEDIIKPTWSGQQIYEVIKKMLWQNWRLRNKAKMEQKEIYKLIRNYHSKASTGFYNEASVEQQKFLHKVKQSKLAYTILNGAERNWWTY